MVVDFQLEGLCALSKDVTSFKSKIQLRKESAVVEIICGFRNEEGSSRLRSCRQIFLEQTNALQSLKNPT
jgi:hypothetical protein